MKALALAILDRLHRRRIRALKTQVDIDGSTRLLRSFSIKFLATPQTRRYLTVGKDGVLAAGFVFEDKSGEIVLGDRCYIGARSTLICRNRIELGDDVTIAWGVTIYDHNSQSLDWRERARTVQHFRQLYGRPECYDELDWTGVKSAPIRIGRRAWIGFDAVILKGVVIGEGAVVAARSVVTRDVDPYTVVGGNPAVPIGHVENEQ